MAGSGYRERAQSRRNTYAVRQLARHWQRSYRETVDQLCDTETRIPFFLETAELHLTPGEEASLPDSRLIRVRSPQRPTIWQSLTGRDRFLNKIKGILLSRTGREGAPVDPPSAGADDELLYLQVPRRLLLRTRRTFRKALRVRVQDVEAYDRRPVQEAKAREGRSHGGKGKTGKRLAHVELIRRALLFDQQMADCGTSWLENTPRDRTLPDVLALLEDDDVRAELIIGGGGAGRRLEVSRVEVDREAKCMDVTDAKGREKFVSFKALADTIARLKKTIR